MATFKVGQRVKKVADIRPEDAIYLSDVHTPNGAEGTVIPIETWPECVVVLYDNYRSDHWSGAFSAMRYQLAPLTDPGADSFIENLKKLKPYEEPKVFQGVTLENVR